MSTTQISGRRAQDKLNDLRVQLRGTYWAEKLWNEELSPTDRRCLGEDLKEVLKELGAIGIWMKLRGCSKTYAVLHIAKIFKLISDGHPTINVLNDTTTQIKRITTSHLFLLEIRRTQEVYSKTTNRAKRNSGTALLDRRVSLIHNFTARAVSKQSLGFRLLSTVAQLSHFLRYGDRGRPVTF